MILPFLNDVVKTGHDWQVERVGGAPDVKSTDDRWRCSPVFYSSNDLGSGAGVMDVLTKGRRRKKPVVEGFNVRGDILKYEEDMTGCEEQQLHIFNKMCAKALLFCFLCWQKLLRGCIDLH